MPRYCKICIRQEIQFSNLTDQQLEAFILSKSITSPKLTLPIKQLLFPNDHTDNMPKNHYVTPNNFYEIQNTKK